jgi:hypothetical protein
MRSSVAELVPDVGGEGRIGLDGKRQLNALFGRDASRLSNQLRNGISNFAQATL